MNGADDLIMTEMMPQGIALADVDPSVGLGFAYVLGGPYGFRAHAAHGPEGFEFALSTEVLFDRESRRRR